MKHRAGPIGDCPAPQCRERVAEKATPFDDYREVARQNMFDELAKEPGRKRVAWELFKSAQESAEQAEARCAALEEALTELVEAARHSIVTLDALKYGVTGTSHLDVNGITNDEAKQFAEESASRLRTALALAAPLLADGATKEDTNANRD